MSTTKIEVEENTMGIHKGFFTLKSQGGWTFYKVTVLPAALLMMTHNTHKECQRLENVNWGTSALLRKQVLYS